MDYSLVKPSDLANIYVHGSQTLIRQLFDKARNQAKKSHKGVLLIFDEMDAVCPQRTTDNHDNQAGEVAEFLTQINNCADDNVYLIGTTNCLARIDKAVIRKGRIDKVVYFGLPDKEARTALFEYELGKRPYSANIDMVRLSDLTAGYAASDITYIVEECARMAFEQAIHAQSNEAVEITQSLVEDVISKTQSSVSPSDLRQYERVRDEYIGGKAKQRRPIGFTVM